MNLFTELIIKFERVNIAQLKLKLNSSKVLDYKLNKSRANQV
jgi:hypothetical protein